MIVKRVEKKHKYRAGGSSLNNRLRYRYGGSSVFSSLLGKTLLRDNIRNLINKVDKSKIVHKVLDSAVDGSKQILSTAVKKGVENIINKKKEKKILKDVIKDLVPKALGKGIVYD